jgi:hypothetical protein
LSEGLQNASDYDGLQGLQKRACESSAAAVEAVEVGAEGSRVQVWTLTTPSHLVAWLVWWGEQECDKGATAVLMATLGLVVGAWGWKGDSGSTLLLECLAGYCALYGKDASRRTRGIAGRRLAEEWNAITNATQALGYWSTGDAETADTFWRMALESFIAAAALAAVERADVGPGAELAAPIEVEAALLAAANDAAHRAAAFWGKSRDVSYAGAELERIGTTLAVADDSAMASTLAFAAAIAGPAAASWVTWAGGPSSLGEAFAVDQRRTAIANDAERARTSSLVEEAPIVHLLRDGFLWSACGASRASVSSSHSRTLRGVTCPRCHTTQAPALVPRPELVSRLFQRGHDGCARALRDGEDPEAVAVEMEAIRDDSKPGKWETQDEELVIALRALAAAVVAASKGGAS